jgi:hypothetical protein
LLSTLLPSHLWGIKTQSPIYVIYIVPQAFAQDSERLMLFAAVEPKMAFTQTSSEVGDADNAPARHRLAYCTFGALVGFILTVTTWGAAIAVRNAIGNLSWLKD